MLCPLRQLWHIVFLSGSAGNGSYEPDHRLMVDSVPGRRLTRLDSRSVNLTAYDFGG